MQRMTGTRAIAGGLGVLVFALAGCSSVRPYDIKITIHNRLQKSSVQVDIVGVKPADLPLWEDYSMTDYWSLKDDMRTDAEMEGMTKVFKFGPAAKTYPSPTLSEKDEIWNTWISEDSEDCEHLLILADIPGEFKDKAGDADPRRLKLPLESGRWSSQAKKNGIEIDVKRSGLSFKTSPKPLK